MPTRRACVFHLGDAQVRLGDFGGAQQRNTTWKSPLYRAGPKDRVPPWALDAQVEVVQSARTPSRPFQASDACMIWRMAHARSSE